MEEEKMDTNPQQGQKISLELLSRDDIIQKYKSLLAIAKKAKQAKDESYEENCSLKKQLQQHEIQKEADKKALMTMKELLEAYTESKLHLATQVSELQKQNQSISEKLERIVIENESLKRQLQRQTEDNDLLLTDIENMERQLKEISVLTKEQKQSMVSLEEEIAQLKESELKTEEMKAKNNELRIELQLLKEKYKFVKDMNTDQRQKFSCLKNRFIEVHKKLLKLKECKRILLETQHEYADAISQWQKEIINASNILCKELNNLKKENVKLLQKSTKDQVYENVDKKFFNVEKLNELLQWSEKAKQDYNQLHEENARLKLSLDIKDAEFKAVLLESTGKRIQEIWYLSESALREYNDILNENIMLKDVKFKGTFDTSQQVFDKVLIKSSFLDELQDLVTIVSQDFKNQSNELHLLKSNIEKLEKENIFCKDERKKLEEKVCLLEQEKILFKKQIKEQMTLKLHNFQEMSVQATLDYALNKAQKEFQNISTDLETVGKENILKDDVPALDNNAGTQETVLQLKEQLLETQQLLEEYLKKYKRKEIDHSELLDEMRLLNEALKVRGDLLSDQQKEHQTLTSELKTNSEKLCKIRQELDEKDVLLNEKRNELGTIKNEISTSRRKIEILENTNMLNEGKVRVLSMELNEMKLNECTNSTDVDKQNDILSSSAISKADELLKFKDVEDSFEDKYNKLRGLAAKLKKKLQEEMVLKQKLEKEIYDLKNSEKELNCRVEEFKNKLSDMDSLNAQLNEKQKQIETLKSENQKLKASRKQANVLNLEIEAAEKSLNEVANKLANRTTELESAKELLKSKDSTISQLRKEIDLLESGKSSEIKHSQELKLQIDHLHKTLKDEMHHKQQACDKTKLLEQDVENLKVELENVKVEFALSTSSQESAFKALAGDHEELISQFAIARGALLECEQKLKKAERTTEDLRVEYLDYKVKAQAVLRKNQNRDSSKERELEEELFAARANERQLASTVDKLNLKMKALENQKDVLTDDNMILQKRSQELMFLIENIRSQNESLNQEIQQNIQQQHESLKQHRQQIECIDNCHKEQIQSLNILHQRQLEQLRQELSQHIRLPTTIGATKSTNLPLYTHTDSNSDHAKLDFLLMEREDGEGSEEAAESLVNLAASRKISNDLLSVKRSIQDFIPLDELLNTPLTAINSETLITNPQHQHGAADALNTGNKIDVLQLELNSTKDRLQKQESRVRHLTALLSESEQDLAKLTQMNDMLKEELRKQERSMEREQHMHNSEYVKNVIMKFLTLNNADEKSRLVPVLNTILKLNRSEAEVLNCVAKGQKVSDTNQRNGGWSNFLSWTNNNINNN